MRRALRTAVAAAFCAAAVSAPAAGWRVPGFAPVETAALSVSILFPPDADPFRPLREKLGWSGTTPLRP